MAPTKEIKRRKRVPHKVGLTTGLLPTRRVVVTGLGPVTSIGIGAEQLWDGLLAGKSGIRRVEDLYDGNRQHFLARVDSGALLKSTPLEVYARLRELRAAREELDVSREVDMQIVATQLALADSQIDYDREDNSIGLVIGVEATGVASMERRLIRFARKLGREREPDQNRIAALLQRYCFKTWFNTYPFTNLFFVTSALGLHGYSTTLNNASTSGLYAIDAAAQEIQRGRTSTMAVVCAEDMEGSLRLRYFEELGVYSKKGTIKPFAAGRDGLVIGEGAGAVILEELNHALKRRARIYGEYRGGGFRMDADKLFRPRLDARHYAAACLEALEAAGLQPRNIDLVLPHGTATKINDEVQALLIKRLFGNWNPPVAVYTPNIGHLMGASGIMRIIIGLLSITRGEIPGTAMKDSIDENCRVNLITKRTKRFLSNVLVSSIAFGGINAGVVISRLSKESSSPRMPSGNA